MMAILSNRRQFLGRTIWHCEADTAYRRGYAVMDGYRLIGVAQTPFRPVSPGVWCGVVVTCGPAVVVMAGTRIIPSSSELEKRGLKTIRTTTRAEYRAEDRAWRVLVREAYDHD